VTGAALAVLAARAAELARPAPGTEYRMRAGQAAWYALHEVDEPLSGLIRGTESDPYADDERLPEFWAWVTEQALEGGL
jgi:hypothetical protein